MDSIISGDGSVDSENLTKVASGENTAQGAKRLDTEESKNGNPFMDTSAMSRNKNRVGPFDHSDQDFMVDDIAEEDEEIDVSELVVEDVNNWKNGSNRSSRSSKALGESSGGLLGMASSSKDTYYDGTINPAGATKKGYYNLSKAEERQDFMLNMNGLGGEIPGELNQLYNDEEDTEDSPLFRGETFKQKSRSTLRSTGLSKGNPFADDEEDSLKIETHKPRFNGMESSRYASMQEMLDEENTSPFSSEKRKGMGGCIDKTFGGKKTKRRKISAVATIVLVCGGIGAALYVILGMKPFNSSELKGSELIAVPNAPTQSPSRGSLNIGPSVVLPPSVLNGSLPALDHIPLPPTFINGSNVTLDVNANITNETSISPENTSSPVSSLFNISMTPTISLAYNVSLSPSVSLNSSIFNSSFTPTSQPSVTSESNSTANETEVGTNSTTDEGSIGNNTMSTNETVSLVPTPSPFVVNISESIMPSLSLNDTANMTDSNETVLPSPAPYISAAPSSVNISSAPFSMNSSESIMPSTLLNETSNTTDSDINQTTVPTPSPFVVNASESLMPSTLMNETEAPSASAFPTPALTNSSLLDELSDPWTLYTSLQHDESSALFGTAVAMSADPAFLVVGAKDALNEAGQSSGAVYVYEFDGNGALTLIQVIYGQSIRDEFGNAVAISDDGNRLVIGSRSEGSEQAGAVRVYSLSASTYVQLGNTISGTTDAGRAGWAVSISGDGSTVAVGSPAGGPEGGGSVLTYQYAGDWAPFGSEITGGTDAAVGYSVSLNSDGSILAVGNPKAQNRDGSQNAGKVASYIIENSVWVVTGEIFGLSSEDVEGTSIALSADGNYLVTGSKGRNGDDGNTESTGSCQLYQNTSGRRWRLRNTLTGQSTDERLGSSVSISRDASVFACGGVAGTLDGFGTYGVVRTWNRRTSIASAIWPRAGDADDSSFGTSLAFSPVGLAIGAPDYSGGDGGDLAGTVEVFSVD
jgi:hypothetical protein